MDPNSARERNASAQVSVRILSVVFVFSVGSLVLPLLASPIPTGKPAASPDWWFVRDVVVTNTGSTNNPPVWPGDYPAADSYAVLVQGQLKNLATKARDEMESAFPNAIWTHPAGIALTNMVVSWNTNTTMGDNYAVINHGQLKTVATKFYDVIAAMGYSAHMLPPAQWTSGRYPWSAGTGDDDNFAVAVAGQAKHLFSFEFNNLDSDADDLPDWWENQYWPGDLTGTNHGKNDDADGDGVSNYIEFLQGRNPIKGAQAGTAGDVGLEVYSVLEGN